MKNLTHYKKRVRVARSHNLRTHAFDAAIEKHLRPILNRSDERFCKLIADNQGEQERLAVKIARRQPNSVATLQMADFLGQFILFGEYPNQIKVPRNIIVDALSRHKQGQVASIQNPKTCEHISMCPKRLN